MGCSLFRNEFACLTWDLSSSLWAIINVLNASNANLIEILEKIKSKGKIIVECSPVSLLQLARNEKMLLMVCYAFYNKGDAFYDDLEKSWVLKQSNTTH